MRFVLAFFFVFSFSSSAIHAQCSGSFGDPLFVENFASRNGQGYGAALPAGITTYQYRNFTGETPNLEDGEYTIATSPSLGRPEWFNTNDQTNDSNGTGQMLIVNADFTTGEFYRLRVNNLCENTTYEFSAWIMNVLPQSVLPNAIPVNVSFRIEDTGGGLLGSTNTGNITQTNDPLWRRFSFEFTIPSGITEVELVMVNNGLGGNGNDLAIDEISLRPCGPQIDLVANEPIFNGSLINNQQAVQLQADIELGVFNSPEVKFQRRPAGLTLWSDLNTFSANTSFLLPAGSYNEDDSFRAVVREGGVNNSRCFINSQIATVDFIDVANFGEVCINYQSGTAEVEWQEVFSFIDVNSLNFNIQSAILISERRGGIKRLSNPSTNPQLSTVCPYDSFIGQYFELAVNSNQEIFLVDDNANLYRVNTPTCDYTLISNNLPVTDGFAMSFDQSDNLYLGGPNDSRVYRYEAGSFTNPSVWFDFQQGQPAGDFVEIGDKLYISWRLNNQDLLYEVNLDADNQYISHNNLGQIADDTFGLAAELGKLYGITRTQVYEIELPDLGFTLIANNPSNNSNNQWFGGAGLNEALDLQYSLYAENELEEAQNGDPTTLPNPLVFNTPGTFLFYVRVVDANTGQVQIQPIEITVLAFPDVEEELEINDLCVSTYPEPFDLTQIPDLLTNDASGLSFSFFQTENGAIVNDNNDRITDFSLENPFEEIFVRVENGACFSVSKVVINSDLFPTPNIIGTTEFCFNDQTTLSVPDNFDTYFWDGPEIPNEANTGSGQPSITVSTPGIYEVTVGLNSCSGSQTAQIEVSHYPRVVIESIAVLNNQAEIAVLGTPPFEYSLDGVNFTTVNTSSFVLNNFTNGQYNIYVRDSNSCETVSQMFNIFSIPNFFSPNGDGVNDTWDVPGVGLFGDVELKVFDRYGKLIHSEEVTDSIHWNGHYLNRPLPSDTYWYIITIGNTQKLTGFLSIRN